MENNNQNKEQDLLKPKIVAIVDYEIELTKEKKEFKTK